MELHIAALARQQGDIQRGAEALDPLGGKEPTKRGEKVDKSFEAALAEAAGQLDQAAGRQPRARRHRLPHHGALDGQG